MNEKRYNRISLLPISAYCPEAARLSERHGAGRAAAKSQAFHAHLAGKPEARKLLALLEPEERAEVESWHTPSTIRIKEGETLVELDFESAEKEVPVALSQHGGYVDPAWSDTWITKGTLDFAWVRQCYGMRVAFVADSKKSDFTSEPDSLQLHGYALAYADKVQADAYVTGIWVLDEGFWRWSEEPPVELASRRAVEIWERVHAAATNTEGQPSSGPHCRGCYGRQHCGEWLLPAALADTNLAPISQPGGINPKNAARLLLTVQALEDLAKVAKEALKAYVHQGGRIEHEGRVWRESFVRGREGVKLEAVRQLLDDLRAELGEEHALVRKYGQIIRRGAGHQRFDWGKA